MQEGSVVSISPSYSNSKTTKMAGSEEVCEEDEFYFKGVGGCATRQSEEGAEFVEGERENHVEDENFDFSFMTRDSELPPPIPADEIFHNGLIRPVYPVLNKKMFLESMKFQRVNGDGKGDSEKAQTIRLPLRELFNEERETSMTMTATSSSSSSDADDLDGIPAESYCVWRPKEAAEGRCKKSSSTGSDSKRWRFKDLLSRSHSDRSNDDFVILSPSSSGKIKKRNENRGKAKPIELKSAAAPPLPPPVYGCEKRRSFLPYRQDLVGVFANVNGRSKRFPSF